MPKIKQPSLHERGNVDAKGNWKPPYPCRDTPVFHKPIQLRDIMNYYFGYGGYLWPKLGLYILLAIGTSFLLDKALQDPSLLTLSFIGFMLIRNVVMILLIYGGYHLILYNLKLQGTRQKYHPEWQATHNKRFMFNNQVKDNIFRTCTHGALIWTSYEVLYVWAVSNGFIPYLSWAEHPIYFVALLILIPFIRESHFFAVHLFLHGKFMMKHVHSVHHKNINPGPWSGMAMHPIEHLLYFSGLLIHFIIPSNPVHFFLNSQLTGLTPASGHIGFEGPIYKERYPTGDYFHYLHHKHVSCNFGTPTVPWDRWAGYFYNGEGKYENLLMKKKTLKTK